MAFDYDEVNPTDSSYIADFPANERAHRLAVLSSVSVDHDAEGLGEHSKVSLQRQGSDPSLSGTAGFVYTKLVGAITELFYLDDTGTVTQMTDDGSASPDKVAIAGDTMTGDLTMDSGDILLEGTSLLKLLNAKYLQGRDVGDANWRDLLGVDASDVCEVGDVLLGGGLRLLADGIDESVIEYGSGDKKIYHAGHFDPPIATAQYTSALQAITFDGVGEVTHGIGLKPELWWAEIECIDAGGDVGYSQGDTIPILGGFGMEDGGTLRGFTVNATDTKFQWRAANNPPKVVAIGGSTTVIDATKWELRFKAWY